MTGTPLYLDMQATTPIDPRVLDAMLPYMVDKYGNPHSRTHAYGWETEDSVEGARKQVLFCDPVHDKVTVLRATAAVFVQLREMHWSVSSTALVCATSFTFCQ